MNGVAARVWHLVNLPAGTDVHRLRKQIGALDRDVRRLSLQLELEQARTIERGCAVTTETVPTSIFDRVRQEVERNALRARNGIRMAAGLSRPNLGATPKDVVWRRGRSELWHYRNDDVRFSPPLLIVFSLFSRSYILDLQPGNSFVERLLSAGFDVYLLDWGVPDERDAANQLEDYVDDYLPAAVERVRHLAGTDEINLLGYCFGSVLVVALRRAPSRRADTQSDGDDHAGRPAATGTADQCDRQRRAGCRNHAR